MAATSLYWYSNVYLRMLWTKLRDIHPIISSQSHYIASSIFFILTQFSFILDHDDVIKWKHFPRYWSFVREFPGEFPQRPVTRSFDVFFICIWINGWVNNREAIDLRRHSAHYDCNAKHQSFCWSVFHETLTPCTWNEALIMILFYIN